MTDHNLKARWEWVRSKPESFPFEEEEIFIDFMASDKIIRQFGNKTPFEFCAGVHKEFCTLKVQPFRILSYLLYFL